MNWPNFVSLLVCAGAASGAWWLARFDAGVADAPGQVVPVEFRISATETARLVGVYVTAGQRVRPGQLLAQLDTTVLEREISVAEARLREFNAEVSASEAVIESSGHQDDRIFQRDATDAAAEWETARAAYAAQQGELAHIQTEIVRQRKLVAEGLVRRDVADELELKAKTMTEVMTQWPSRLEMLGSRHREAVRRLNEWRSEYSPSLSAVKGATRLQPSKERVAEQVKALQVLRARLQLSRLTAPTDGEVVTVLAQSGDVAPAGAPILILHSPERGRRVVAYVNERDSERLVPGARAVIRRRTDSRKETPSRVSRIGGAVVPLPQRFWIVQTIPQWGREVELEMPTPPLDAGEAVDVKLFGAPVNSQVAEARP
jgi:HlyD family secretion protein